MLCFLISQIEKKNILGTEALNPNNLICESLRFIKKKFPGIGIMCDVALDPYTSHGHDGIIINKKIDNDKTIEILVKQALLQARMGCDVIAPSDMMDGRIGKIRKELDKNKFEDVQIISYAVKYASSFYGPFRDAVGSKGALRGDKKTYQMDFGNRKEAIVEAQRDIDEGADIIMIKPGIAYLDIIRDLKENITAPLAAYQVSGEYAMLKAAAERGWLDHDQIMMEQLLSFKRAGASMIASYFAEEAVKLI